MAFQKKTWVDRLTEFATRRIITNATTREETLVEVARAEGEIYEPGDAFNADTMNDLEDRIAAQFEEVGKGVGVVDTYDNVMQMISQGKIGEETFVSITDDSDDDSISAIAIDYDNTNSGMTATEVQGAIDELSTHLSLTSVHLSGNHMTSSANYLYSRGNQTALVLQGTTDKAYVAGTQYIISPLDTKYHPQGTSNLNVLTNTGARIRIAFDTNGVSIIPLENIPINTYLDISTYYMNRGN